MRCAGPSPSRTSMSSSEGTRTGSRTLPSAPTVSGSSPRAATDAPRSGTRRSGANLAWLEGHRAGLRGPRSATDGKLVATASRDGTATNLGRGHGGGASAAQRPSTTVTRVAFSPRGGRVVTTEPRRDRPHLERPHRRYRAVLQGPRKWVTDAEYTADGETIVTASDDGTVRLWEAASGRTEGDPASEVRGDLELAVSPASPWIFSARAHGGRNAAVLWDSRTGRKLRRLPLNGGVATAAAFSADGTRLATGEIDGTVRVWKVASGERLAVLKGHTGAIADLSFSEDGARLATASGDGTAKLWNVADGQVTEELRGHGGG